MILMVTVGDDEDNFVEKNDDDYYSSQQQQYINMSQLNHNNTIRVRVNTTNINKYNYLAANQQIHLILSPFTE